MKKVLVFITCLLMVIPVYINASGTFNYADGEDQASKYMIKEVFRKTHERYIKQTSLSHFISLPEFKATCNENERSYLFDGVEFWTSTAVNSSKHYIINYKGVEAEADNNLKYSVKDIEYVNSDVKVRGSGTYSNPWSFTPMYEVKVITDTKYGHILDNGAELGVKSVYAANGEDVVMQLEKAHNTGYRYITNDCNASFSNGYLTISNVKRNMTCKVIFGTGKFKITLIDSTTDKIISNYKDNFYKDENLNSVITKVNIPSKTGFNFQGYKYEDTMVVNPDGTLNRAATNVITEDITLNPTYSISAPSNVAISGSADKIYHTTDTTLTCSNSTTYSSGTKLYYSFGYATSDGGSPSYWTTASETNTYKINKDSFFGNRYYSCRVYATDSSTSSTSITVASPTTSDVLVSYKNATITFNANGGSLSGTSPLYTRYGETGLYSGILNSTSASAPSATKTGYSLSGWYTAASGGSSILNSNGTLASGAVSGYKTASTWAVEENKTLYAHYTGIKYNLSYALDGGTHGTNHPTEATYGTSFTVNNPTKSITVTLTVASGISINYTGSSFTKKTATISYTFDGWDISNMTNTSHTIGGSTQSGTTANGVTGTSFNNLRTTSGTVAFTATWKHPTITLPKITKSGYICKWTSSNPTTISDRASGGTYNPNDSGGATARTFEAKCTVDKYTITLDANGGSSGTSKIYEKPGTGVYVDSDCSNAMTTTANPITAPKRSGYAFTGYYTKTSNGTQMIDKYGYKTSNFSNTHFTSDGTLYAQWKTHGNNDHVWKARGNTIYDVGFTWYVNDDHSTTPYTRAYGIYCSECHMSVRYYQINILGGTYGTVAAFISPEHPYDVENGYTILDDSSLGGSFENYKKHGSGYLPVLRKP